MAVPSKTTFPLLPPFFFSFVGTNDMEALLSKVLGWAVITGSSLVKVPQIINVVKSHSAEGLSNTSLALESVAFLITVAYCFCRQFPFSTYGESVFILFQDVVIAALIANLSRVSHAVTGAAIAAFAAVLWGLLFGGFVPAPALAFAQLCTIPVFTVSKIPQIWLNFKNGSTGQLSLITFALNFAGSAARIFTTLSELSDTIMLISSILGFTLNGIITAQILWYWKISPAAPVPEAEKDKK